MFCPLVTASLVKPYIILTFLSTTAVRVSSHISFVSNLSALSNNVVKKEKLIQHCDCHLTNVWPKTMHFFKKSTPKSRLFVFLDVRTYFSNQCLYCICEWLLLHVITNGRVLLLGSSQQMSFREQHVRGNGVSRDTGPRPIVYPKLCELTHLTAS